MAEFKTMLASVLDTGRMQEISDTESNITLKGLSGSSRALFFSNYARKFQGCYLAILDDYDEAAYFYSDISGSFTDLQLLFFPASYKRSVQFGSMEPENIILRTEVLSRITAYKSAPSDSDSLIIITYPESLVEKVTTEDNLAENTLEIVTGSDISIDFINEVLHEYEFERVDFVYEPGQYAIRGSIVDIFSFANDLPFRIDFFGDEVETIRSFDLNTQLSKQHHEQIHIIPNLQINKDTENRISFFEFLPEKVQVFTNKKKYCAEKVSEVFRATSAETLNDEMEVMTKSVIMLNGKQIDDALSKYRLFEFNGSSRSNTVFDFDTAHQPQFNKSFDILIENLQNYFERGYTLYICSENKNQFSRLDTIFEQSDAKIPYTAVNSGINAGFIDHDNKICCYTDHQIFERYHRYKLKSTYSKKESISLKELNNLQPGDYVVHVDHGIGKFGGLDNIDVNGKKQEAIRLIYKNNDILYVSIHSLHRISKYKGKDGDPPKIYKLGSGAWQKLKAKTKSKVKDIAKDLIALYAKRKEQEGFAFAPDSFLQAELEASFFYEDTPDQFTATQHIKGDMEKTIPMDRLICGDVGFGKTELAIRAAFKAVCDNKQVAILVPTTILAWQHFKTFSDRLKEFPVTIDYISRMKKGAEQRASLKNLEAGKTDIMIGTHRLIGKDITFKDLGLLIIDEEQKFGVSVKEKLRHIKINVDTLTLTATPIPRTLQFSLMGARDLSILRTPPANRHPVVTEVHSFNEDIIREGIQYEVQRGGQVFFINNRIQNIHEVESALKRFVPNIKTVVAHGQMEGKQLEQIMLDFINGDYDVLLATSIIESGLDIPNANTIFINNAQNFGLSDLHQLRGRVGRSNKKAFCYLIAPPLSVLPDDSRRRLRAIEEFSELGSGFNISMQDLDIRGAGNMLGAEQSGYIAEIGYETYQRILDEALLELKEGEFKDLFADEKNTEEKQQTVFLNDCTIDTDFELHLPDYYVSNVAERIKLYRELDNIDNSAQLVLFEENLIDRFGKLPKPTQDLLLVVRLRRLSMKLGLEKIIMKFGKMICYFISSRESGYYKSPMFPKMLHYVQANAETFRMKEAKDKLSVHTDDITDIQQAYQLIEKMYLNLFDNESGN